MAVRCPRPARTALPMANHRNGVCARSWGCARQTGILSKRPSVLIFEIDSRFPLHYGVTLWQELVDEYRDTGLGTDGWTPLSRVGDNIKTRDPAFDPRALGKTLGVDTKRLSDLLGAMPEYETMKERNVNYVRRRTYAQAVSDMVSDSAAK